MHPTNILLSSLTAHLLPAPFKRSQTGIFGGKSIQFGNNVPFSKHKTRRTWLPNVQRKGLYSEVLGRELTVKVTTRALRTIRKHGGIDQYILNSRTDALSPQAMRIRIMLRDKQEELARAAASSSSTSTVDVGADVVDVNAAEVSASAANVAAEATSESESRAINDASPVDPSSSRLSTESTESRTSAETQNARR